MQLFGIVEEKKKAVALSSRKNTGKSLLSDALRDTCVIGLVGREGGRSEPTP